MDPEAVVMGVALDRSLLIARVDSRIDRMIRHGFPEEVRWLLDRGYSPTLPSMSSIGYGEMTEYVEGRSDLNTTVCRIRRATRRLIRRQHAWFRPSDERIVWLNGANGDAAVEQAVRIVQGVKR